MIVFLIKYLHYCVHQILMVGMGGGVGEGVCHKILKGKLFLLLFVAKQGHPASTK